jgi:hypothetical protein
MAAPCFESQAQDKLKLPKEVLAAFTDRMLEHLKVGRSYPETLNAMSQESGLQPETINSIFKRDPQRLSITKQTIARAGQVRMLRNAADAFAEQLKTDGKLQQEPGLVAKAWDLNRRAALFGHSPVFPWTHMRNWAVQIPTEAGRARMGAFWRAATDVYKYAGERGKALYEMDMAMMQMGDRYDFWKSSGADIVPGKRTPGDILLQSRKPSWQTRNFDALKPARYTALEQIWSNLDPALKQGDTGKAVGAMLARDMDYATGSVMPPAGEAANPLAKSAAQLSQLAGHYNLLLSSKLFFAKHMDAWLSPLRYLAKSGRMTPPERAAANVALGRWANTVAAHLSILGANYAFNKMMGWQTPNLTDPNKSDYLRIRLGNVVVPFSPMLEALRLPIVFTAAMVGKGGSDTAGTKLWRAVWNAAHPSFHTLYEQVSGKDFMGRPVPSLRGLANYLAPSVVPPATVSKAKAQTPVTPMEYAATRFTPIAVSGGVREFYQALRDQRLDGNMAMAFLKGAGASASSALLGTHMYEEEPKVPYRPSASRTYGPPKPPRRTLRQAMGSVR